MAYFRRKFYYNENNMPDGLKPIYAGFDLLQSHPLFSQLDGTIAVRNAHLSCLLYTSFRLPRIVCH